MDNGDPELEQGPELTFHMRSKKTDGKEILAHFDVTATVRGTRNCADCGNTLKELSMDMDGTAELAQFEGWKELTPDQQGEVQGRLEAGTVEPDAEAEEGTVDESGGGRYKKNLITTVVPYNITIEDSELGIKLTYNGELSYEAAASEFEECC